MNLSTCMEFIIDIKGIYKSDLAEMVGENPKAFIARFNRNGITGQELVKICTELNIDISTINAISKLDLNSVSLESFVSNIQKQTYRGDVRKKERNNIDYKCLNPFLKNTLFVGAVGCGKTMLIKLLIIDLMKRNQQTVILSPYYMSSNKYSNEYSQLVKQLKGKEYIINDFSDISKINIKNNITLITIPSFDRDILDTYTKSIFDYLNDVEIKNLVLDGISIPKAYPIKKLRNTRIYASTIKIRDIEDMLQYYDDFILGLANRCDLKYLDKLDIDYKYFDDFLMLNTGQFILYHEGKLNEIKCYMDSKDINLITN